jgi:sigma-B regulation protein RsbQ
MTILQRNNVSVTGRGSQPIMFAHGYGCDQNMWRFVAPAFELDHRVILFDHVGHGRSDPSAYRPQNYASLDGYADDVIEICTELGVERVTFVGHSVSAMIGVLAAVRRPDLIERLVLIGPSPCYIDDGDYVGGFKREDIEGLLDFLDANHLGWSSTMAPVIMGNGDRPELADELANSFCRTDPEVAKHFARVTFLSDNRADLAGLAKLAKKTLVLQCSNDVIAPEAVGRYVADRIPGSAFVLLEATGHCPNLSAPDETVAAIRRFLAAGSHVETSAP